MSHIAEMIFKLVMDFFYSLLASRCSRIFKLIVSTHSSR